MQNFFLFPASESPEGIAARHEDITWMETARLIVLEFDDQFEVVGFSFGQFVTIGAFRFVWVTFSGNYHVNLLNWWYGNKMEMGINKKFYVLFFFGNFTTIYFLVNLNKIFSNLFVKSYTCYGKDTSSNLYICNHNSKRSTKAYTIPHII